MCRFVYVVCFSVWENLITFIFQGVERWLSSRSVEKQNGHYLSTSTWGGKAKRLNEEIRAHFLCETSADSSDTVQLVFHYCMAGSKKQKQKNKWWREMEIIINLLNLRGAAGWWLLMFCFHFNFFYTYSSARREERTKFRWKHFHQRVQCRREFVLTHSSVANLLRR